MANDSTLVEAISYFLNQRHSQPGSLKLIKELIPYSYTLIRKVLNTLAESRTIYNNSIHAFLQYILFLVKWLYEINTDKTIARRISQLLFDPSLKILKFALSFGNSEKYQSVALEISYYIMRTENNDYIYRIFQYGLIPLLISSLQDIKQTK